LLLNTGTFDQVPLGNHANFSSTKAVPDRFESTGFPKGYG
jgi:hypothetical protein